MKARGTRFLCLALAAGIFTSGCSKGTGLTEVEGTVKLQGKPLGKVMVEFLPDVDRATTGPRSSATTDSQGRYKLVCDDQRPGAVVGHHRVLLRDLLPYDDLPKGGGADLSKARPSRIPARYQDAAQTPLRKEVKGPAPQTINLEITP